MAIKPPDLLNRIPTVAELLEKPPIRALVERWNQSAVAASVKSFLDELGTDLQRRAAEANLPSLRELTERAARYVVSQRHHALGIAINATGRLWDSPWRGLPLSDAALERAYTTGREFAFASAPLAASITKSQALLCQLSGAQRAAIVHSYAGAVWLTLAALASDREALVARAEVGDVGSSDSLPKLTAAANVKLIEVGTMNSALSSDYESAASPRTAAVLMVNSDTYRVVGQTSQADLEELVALARDRELVSIAALSSTPITTPPATLGWTRRSAESSLKAGVDVAILRGDGLMGGPPCGIILGNKDAVSRITSHPLFAAWNIDSLRLAALTATLECYENRSPGVELIPVWQCLTVSVDNLRNRAERVAAQLAAAPGIESALPVETKSAVAAAVAEGLPSFGVVLAPIDGDVESLDKRLRSGRMPVVGRVEGEKIILDLRTVLPRQDTTLVDAITADVNS